jgi:hypothetical protein
MKFPELTHLYKYYTYNHYSLSAPARRKIWFSKPASFNDPFDLDIDFVDRVTLNDFLYMINELRKQPGISKEMLADLAVTEVSACNNPDLHAFYESWRAANRKFSEDRKGYGVFCLTERNDHVLMWSHYADNHKGFCIEFIRSPHNQLGDIEMTCPVRYRCDYPRPVPFSEEGRRTLFDYVFLTKAKDWEYEREWRLVNEEGNIELPLPGDVSSVIFGLRMPEPQRETIRHILSDLPNITYRETKRVSGRFALQISDI